jgi:hypothetical protein
VIPKVLQLRDKIVFAQQEGLNEISSLTRNKLRGESKTVNIGIFSNRAFLFPEGRQFLEYVKSMEIVVLFSDFCPGTA